MRAARCVTSDVWMQAKNKIKLTAPRFSHLVVVPTQPNAVIEDACTWCTRRTRKCVEFVHSSTVREDKHARIRFTYLVARRMTRLHAHVCITCDPRGSHLSHANSQSTFQLSLFITATTVATTCRCTRMPRSFSRIPRYALRYGHACEHRFRNRIRSAVPR